MSTLLKLPSWKNCFWQALTIELKHSVLSERVMYAAYHPKLGGTSFTSFPCLSNIPSKNFRCHFSSSTTFWSIIILHQICWVDDFLWGAVLSCLDLPDSFWSAWGSLLGKVAVMVNLDLTLMSLYSSFGWQLSARSGKFFCSPCCMPYWVGLKTGLCILRT